MRKIIFHTFLLIFVSTACSKFARLQKSTDLIEKYEGAMAYYEKESYEKSSLLLEEIIPLLKGRKEGEMAQYRVSYCYYYMGQYELASFYFKRFYQTYGRSEYAQEAMFMQAYCLYKDSPEYNLDQANTKQAIAAIQNYLNAYPTTERLEEANAIIKELRAKLEKKAYANALQYYKMKNYKAAIVVLENFQQDYPDSDYVEEVLFKKLEMEYLLAKNSVRTKQQERYEAVMVTYDELLEEYPKSEYMKGANSYYDNSVKKLATLKQETDKKLQTEKEDKANQEKDQPK